MNERCIFCYDPYQDHFEELASNRPILHLKPIYTICDNCLETIFPGQTKQEVIAMLEKGVWINGVCYSIKEGPIIA